MAKAVETAINGIKCDAPSCDYRDDSVSVYDYDEWLDRPCPKCGANLLTSKDLEATKLLHQMAEWLSAIVGDVPADSGQRNYVEVHMDGSGIPRFK